MPKPKQPVQTEEPVQPEEPVATWFGWDWDAPICKQELKVDTPLMEMCYVCRYEIVESDSGMILNLPNIPLRYIHHDCLIYGRRLRGYYRKEAAAAEVAAKVGGNPA